MDTLDNAADDDDDDDDVEYKDEDDATKGRGKGVSHDVIGGNKYFFLGINDQGLIAIGPSNRDWKNHLFAALR